MTELYRLKSILPHQKSRDYTCKSTLLLKCVQYFNLYDTRDDKTLYLKPYFSGQTIPWIRNWTHLNVNLKSSELCVTAPSPWSSVKEPLTGMSCFRYETAWPLSSLAQHMFCDPNPLCNVVFLRIHPWDNWFPFSLEKVKLARFISSSHLFSLLLEEDTQVLLGGKPNCLFQILTSLGTLDCRTLARGFSLYTSLELGSTTKVPSTLLSRTCVPNRTQEKFLCKVWYSLWPLLDVLGIVTWWSRTEGSVYGLKSRIHGFSVV